MFFQGVTAIDVMCNEGSEGVNTMIGVADFTQEPTSHFLNDLKVMIDRGIGCVAIK